MSIIGFIINLGLLVYGIICYRNGSDLSVGSQNFYIFTIILFIEYIVFLKSSYDDNYDEAFESWSKAFEWYMSGKSPITSFGINLLAKSYHEEGYKKFLLSSFLYLLVKIITFVISLFIILKFTDWPWTYSLYGLIIVPSALALVVNLVSFIGSLFE